MTFRRNKVGFDNSGRPLFEYELVGTPYVIVRMNPETSEGWSIHNKDINENVLDAWLLRDAKALTIRTATEVSA